MATAWTPPQFSLYAAKPQGLSALQRDWTGFYTAHNVEEAQRESARLRALAIADAELEQRRRDEEDRANQWVQAEKVRAQRDAFDMTKFNQDLMRQARHDAENQRRFDLERGDISRGERESARRFRISTALQREGFQARYGQYEPEPSDADKSAQAGRLLDARTAVLFDNMVAAEEKRLGRALTTAERGRIKISPEQADTVKRIVAPDLGKYGDTFNFDPVTGRWSGQPIGFVPSSRGPYRQKYTATFVIDPSTGLAQRQEVEIDASGRRVSVSPPGSERWQTIADWELKNRQQWPGGKMPGGKIERTDFRPPAKVPAAAPKDLSFWEGVEAFGRDPGIVSRGINSFVDAANRQSFPEPSYNNEDDYVSAEDEYTY